MISLSIDCMVDVMVRVSKEIGIKVRSMIDI